MATSREIEAILRTHVDEFPGPTPADRQQDLAETLQKIIATLSLPMEDRRIAAQLSIEAPKIFITIALAAIVAILTIMQVEWKALSGGSSGVLGFLAATGIAALFSMYFGVICINEVSKSGFRIANRWHVGHLRLLKNLQAVFGIIATISFVIAIHKSLANPDLGSQGPTKQDTAAIPAALIEVQEDQAALHAILISARQDAAAIHAEASVVQHDQDLAAEGVSAIEKGEMRSTVLPPVLGELDKRLRQVEQQRPTISDLEIPISEQQLLYYAWRRIQAALASMGFPPGDIDGLPGKRTRNAIRAYQAKSDVAQTGVLTEDQIRMLWKLPMKPPLSSDATPR